MTGRVTIMALENVPLIARGDELAAIVTDALLDNDITLTNGDILVLAQKIVSKAEGRDIDLRTITPGQRARDIARTVHKDPRLVEVILSESRAVIRQAPGVLITEHRHGWIMANAGIDASNVSANAGNEMVLLLPHDPDQFCADLRAQLAARFEANIGVIVNDSFGRPWRLGTTGVALGAAGLPSLWDRRGQRDLFGRELKVSQQAIADELAAAASLLQGQAAEGRPIVLIRGFDFGTFTIPTDRPAADLIRSASEDLFR